MAKQPFPPQLASDQPPKPPREYPVVQQSSAQAPAVPHHSSPTPGNKQTPLHETLPKNTHKTIKKMPDVPMHVTKHANPVGRPKNKRY